MVTAIKKQNTIAVCPKCKREMVSEHGEAPHCLFHPAVTAENDVKTTSNHPLAPDKLEAKNEKPAADPGAAAPGKTIKSSKDLAPAPEKPTSKIAIHQYYEDYKDRIIEDYKKLGVIPTSVNWDIPNSVLYRLLKDWGIRKYTKKLSPSPDMVTASKSKSEVKQRKPAAILPPPQSPAI
jgi:hypothetical protein